MASWLRGFAQAFTGIASEDFNTWLRDQYDLSPPSVPEFHAGNLTSTLSHACEQGRAVLIWLHGHRGALCDSLVRDVWTSSALRRCVDDGQLVCWAGDVFRNEPYNVAVALRVERFPTVALLKPIATEGAAATSAGGDHGGAEQSLPRFRVGFVLQGEVRHADLMTRLQHTFARDLAEQQLRQAANAMMRSVNIQAQEARRRQEAVEVLRQQETEELPLFCALYESEYTEGHPDFLEVDFKEAMAEAARQDKMLLAWFRSTSNRGADEAFGTEVWPSEVVQALAREHFLVWPGDVDRWLGPSQLWQLLQAPGDTALVAFRPMSVHEVDGLGFLLGRVLEGNPCEHPAGTAWSVVDWLDASGAVDGAAVAEFLCDVGARWEAQKQAVEEERAGRQRETDERRALREAQDAEFNESLRVDQETERRRQVEAAVAEAARAAAASAEAKAAEPTPLELKRRAAAAELLAAGPPAIDPASRCTLVVRLPSGHRVERQFRASDTVETVYRWADCAGELAALSNPGAKAGAGESAAFEVPEHFILCVTFPRQPLADRSAELRAAGLCPNAVLALSGVDPPQPAEP